MHIVITGGTGFIGSRLCKHFSDQGIKVYALTRNATRGQAQLGDTAECLQWNGKTSDGWQDKVDGALAVINLAGANVAERRWSDEYKRIIMDSRVNAGQAITAAIQAAKKKPKLLLQASATGIYGSRDDEILSEESSYGEGFLADVVKAWEESVSPVKSIKGVRVVFMRIGVVLGKEDGALKKMLLPFKMFVGGPVGSGKQWLSWIHIMDVINAVQFFIDNKKTADAYNLVSPNPVRMKEFSETVGRALSRPSWLPVPDFAVKLLFQEMGNETVLSSQKVLSTRLQEANFKFHYPDLLPALDHLLNSDVTA